MNETGDRHRCTLTRDDAAGRIDADRALADRVVGTERLEQSLRVVFAGGADGRRLVDTFVANERRCCASFDFTIIESAATVTLEIAAPPAASAQQLVDAAQRAFERGPDAVEPPVERNDD